MTGTTTVLKPEVDVEEVISTTALNSPALATGRLLRNGRRICCMAVSLLGEVFSRQMKSDRCENEKDQEQCNDDQIYRAEPWVARIHVAMSVCVS